MNACMSLPQSWLRSRAAARAHGTGNCWFDDAVGKQDSILSKVFQASQVNQEGLFLIAVIAFRASKWKGTSTLVLLQDPRIPQLFRNIFEHDAFGPVEAALCMREAIRT